MPGPRTRAPASPKMGDGWPGSTCAAFALVLLSGCSTVARAERIAGTTAHAALVAVLLVGLVGLAVSAVELARGTPRRATLAVAAAWALVAVFADAWALRGALFGVVPRGELTILAASVAPMGWLALAAASRMGADSGGRKAAIAIGASVVTAVAAVGLAVAGAVCVLPGSPVTQVVTDQLSCEILADGEVACWYRGTVRRVPGISAAREIAVRDVRACVLDDHGDVRCLVADGALEAPVAHGATAVVASEFQACALLSSGEVACDVRGDSWFEVADPMLPIGVSASALSAGRSQVCALSSGRTLCWGRQIGPDWTELATPTPIESLDGLDAVATSDGSLLGLRGGRIVSWGQIGPGPHDVVEHPEVPDATALAANDATACALARNGDVWCVEDAGFSRVTLPGPAAAISAGPGSACAIVGGEPWCWGSDRNDQLIGAVPEDCDVDPLDIVFDPCVPIPQRLRPGG
jgi:hypothetical protein